LTDAAASTDNEQRDKRRQTNAFWSGEDRTGQSWEWIWDVELELDLGLGLVLEVDTDRVPTLSLSFL